MMTISEGKEDQSPWAGLLSEVGPYLVRGQTYALDGEYELVFQMRTNALSTLLSTCVALGKQLSIDCGIEPCEGPLVSLRGSLGRPLFDVPGFPAGNLGHLHKVLESMGRYVGNWRLANADQEGQFPTPGYDRDWLPPWAPLLRAGEVHLRDAMGCADRSEYQEALLLRMDALSSLLNACAALGEQLATDCVVQPDDGPLALLREDLGSELFNSDNFRPGTTDDLLKCIAAMGDFVVRWRQSNEDAPSVLFKASS
jgi:hypothetical protein